MTSNNKLQFNIVAGPSKFDLMLSLMGGCMQPHHTVEFKLEGTCDPVEVAISMISREDGTGESWILKGYTTNNSDISGNYSFEGYFSTQNRKGWLRFVISNHFVHERDGKLLSIVKAVDRCDIADYIDYLRGIGYHFIPHEDVYGHR